MPNPQLYASIVAGNPAAPTQLYVAIVDANGNIIGSTFTAPQGRLTNLTLTPVPTATTAAATSVFYTPYSGNIVPIYDGTVIQPTEFAELSNVLADSATGKAGPAAGAASENYDMFVWNDAGTLRLTRGPVWTNATTRSAGTALVMVKGLLLNNAAITNGPAASRGTYVGTIRTDAGGATVTWSIGGSAAGGTLGALNVWNMYNRRFFTATVINSNGNWTYSSATIRAAEGSATMRVNMVRGLQEDDVWAQYHAVMTLVASATTFGVVGIGLDVTNGYTQSRGQLNSQAAAALSGAQKGTYVGNPGLGFHFLSANENGDGTNNVTFIGTNAITGNLIVQAWA